MVIELTMEDSQMKNGDKIVMSNIKVLPSVGLVLIIKMGSLRSTSMTSVKVHE